jgi:hypothetical protein
MDTSAFFIKDKAVFGDFPTQDTVNQLESSDFRFFIDLTNELENNIVPYKTSYTYIKFSIKDRDIPQYDLSFIEFIFKIVNIIIKSKEEEKLYLHCRGGHGRSGIIVSCIICCLFNWSSKKSLYYTNMCHSNRKNMRDKWRKIGSPQTLVQKNFVKNTCSVYKICSKNPLSIQSNFYIKCPSWIGYFNTLEDGIKYFATFNICEKYVINYLVRLRFKQHPILQTCLKNTGCKILLFTEVSDVYNSILCNVFNAFRMELYK